MPLLSPHFTVEEMTRSAVAIRKHIDNTPDSHVLENLRVLAQKLEAVRLILGRPLLITSGYRCPQLNAAIGGSSTSSHMTGLAADIECPAFGTPQDVFDLLREHRDVLGYDQLILEFPPDGWVHIGLPQPGKVARSENLIYAGKNYERVA